MVTFADDLVPLAPRDADGDGNDGEKRYRKTPHPTLTKHFSQFDGKNSVAPTPGKEPSDDNLNACITDIPSPEAGDSNQSGNGHSGEDDEAGIKGNEAAKGSTHAIDEFQQWLEVTCAKETPSPNLEAFLAAKEVREDAKHAFENVLQECLQTMMQAMTEDLLRESVGVVYEEQGERFESHESSIMATFQSNHERRTHLIQLVEQANSNWTRQYKKIRSSIWKVGEEESEKDDGSKIHSSGVGDVDDLARTHGLMDPSEPALKSNSSSNAIEQSASRGGGENDGGNGSSEPNWDDIAKYEPARDNVQSFLAAREKLRCADESLLHGMDVIHSGLKTDADAIAQVVIDMYNQHENDSTAVEQDIQYHFMSNYQRRDEFEKRLQDSAKQAQGLIDNLLSRLGRSR